MSRHTPPWSFDGVCSGKQFVKDTEMAVRFILIYYIDYFFTPPRLRLKQAVA
jgi:hypothetical protein